MAKTRFFGQSGRTAAASPPYRRLRVETLEERRLLSATSDIADLDVFSLHSLEGAACVLYLDFDGNTTIDTAWNSQFNSGNQIDTPSFSLDDNNEIFSTAELAAIYSIWQRVAEDYLPFEIDVTTEKPAGDDCSAAGVQRVCIGGSCTDWYLDPAGGNTCTGVAYPNTFNAKADTPCYAFADNCDGIVKGIADVISHESGHTFGLVHDGCTTGSTTVEYYAGAGGWGPIMGAPYWQELTQWSKGDYSGAVNVSNGSLLSGQQDDLSVIAGVVKSLTAGSADGYRTDDFSGDFASAETIALDDSTGLATGIVERTGDVDCFTYTADSETLEIWVGGVSDVTNLDVSVRLYDSNKTLLATYDPTETLYVEFTYATSVGAIYYLTVTGTGKTEDSTFYYSNYGSLGAYDVQIGTPRTLLVTTKDDMIAVDGRLSLREAILAAGSRTVIRFAVTLKGASITLNDGAFELTRSVTIDATNLGTTDADSIFKPGVTINAHGASRIFQIEKARYQFDGETANLGSGTLEVALKGLTLTGGFASTEGRTVYGGAIFANGGALTVESCLFSENRVTRTESSDYLSGGGAIYTGGNLTIRGSVFEENTASNCFGGAVLVLGGLTTISNSRFIGNGAIHGGAIYTSGNLTLLDSVFEGNIASNGFGGAVLASGNLTTISNSRFIGNGATRGGALYLNGPDAAISESKFYENTAVLYGGAADLYNSVSFENCDISRNKAVRGGGLYIVTDGVVTFESGTFGGNEAESTDTNVFAYGGGVYNLGNLTVIGSLIAGNAVFGVIEDGGSYRTGFGGGIYNFGTLRLNQSTVAGNYAAYYGGGVFNSQTFSATNSILLGNRTVFGANDFYANAAATLNYSLYGAKIGTVSGTGGLTAGADAVFTQFTTVTAANWTETLYQSWDLRPTAGSKAIDVGNNDLAVDAQGNSLSFDLAGNGRFYDGDGNGTVSVDMGAYEYIFQISGRSVTVQAGCDFYLDGEMEGKTVLFDINGDGEYDDFSASGWVSAAAFSAVSGETFKAVALDALGNRSTPFLFTCTIIPQPTVWTVASGTLADGAILKLGIAASAAAPVRRWTVAWGDGSSSEVDSTAWSLLIAHYYSTDVSADYTVTLTAELADGQTCETVRLLTHRIVRPDSFDATLVTALSAADSCGEAESSAALSTSDERDSDERTAAILRAANDSLNTDESAFFEETAADADSFSDKTPLLLSADSAVAASDRLFAVWFGAADENSDDDSDENSDDDSDGDSTVEPDVETDLAVDWPLF